MVAVKKAAKKTPSVKKPMSQSLKSVGYKVVHTWSDGMEEREGFFEYKGKLWSNGDVLFRTKTMADTSRKGTQVVVADPHGRGYFVLTRARARK